MRYHRKDWSKTRRTSSSLDKLYSERKVSTKPLRDACILKTLSIQNLEFGRSPCMFSKAFKFRHVSFNAVLQRVILTHLLFCFIMSSCDRVLYILTFFESFRGNNKLDEATHFAVLFPHCAELTETCQLFFYTRFPEKIIF